MEAVGTGAADGRADDSLLQRALPPGVVATVFGDAGTGAALVSAGVDVVVHIGSTRAGRAIAVAASHHGTRTVLENGGNDALVVDAGVDPAWAAGQIALGSFVNAGQLCTGVERVYVHAALYDEVFDGVVAAAQWGPGGEHAIGRWSTRIIARRSMPRSATPSPPGAGCWPGGPCPRGRAPGTRRRW